MKHAYHIIEDHSNNHLLTSVQFIRAAYNRLASQQDLSPNNHSVNTDLTALVQSVSKWEEQGLFTYNDLLSELPDILEKLPPLCARAECEMEKWWARKIILGLSELEDFWYLDNYTHLVNAELDLIQNTNKKTVVFLGSGSLPLTTLLYARQAPDTNFICIDNDPEACQLSADLVRKLGCHNQIQIIETPANNYAYTSDHLVICASLLRAPDLYEQLYDNKIESLVVRDAEGLYRILYAPAHRPEKTRYIETHRTLVKSEHINTSRFYERFSP